MRPSRLLLAALVGETPADVAFWQRPRGAVGDATIGALALPALRARLRR
jgi:hypothetical protein